MLPIPGWPSTSTPRPYAGKVFATPPVVTCHELRGPKPWPATCVEIVATPDCALVAAASRTLLAEPVKPCPKMATGHPPAGVGPGGSTSRNGSRSVLTGAGPPSSVGVCSIVRSGRSQFGAAKEPKTRVPAWMALGAAELTRAPEPVSRR